MIFLLTEWPNGNEKRDGQRRQLHQTAIRYYSTDYASHPTTNSDVNRGEKFNYEKFA